MILPPIGAVEQCRYSDLIIDSIMLTESCHSFVIISSGQKCEKRKKTDSAGKQRSAAVEKPVGNVDN